jgi:hypothetical protein
MLNIADELVEKIKTHVLSSINFFPKIFPLMRCGKIFYSWTGHR